MNRTIEQWNVIAGEVGNSFLIQAISALLELARKRDELVSVIEILLCDVEEAEYMTGREREMEARSVLQSIKEQTK